MPTAFLIDAFLQIGLMVVYFPFFVAGEVDHGIRFHLLPWWRAKG